jgi:hypothetical protein
MQVLWLFRTSMTARPHDKNSVTPCLTPCNSVVKKKDEGVKERRGEGVKGGMGEWEKEWEKGRI